MSTTTDIDKPTLAGGLQGLIASLEALGAEGATIRLLEMPDHAFADHWNVGVELSIISDAAVQIARQELPPGVRLERNVHGFVFRFPK
ncbi:MAG TPA: hypothetical protein VLF67_04580 [Candidatus Saccharimonas sp.]|nr:hypothetical protein [Candidatus Saccharimonas sp.]